MQEIPAPMDIQTEIIDQETRQQMFYWAAEQVRESVSGATWQAFWLTSVEGKSGMEAAKSLGLSVGAVYVARCRTLSRIKSLIESFSEDPQ